MTTAREKAAAFVDAEYSPARDKLWAESVEAFLAGWNVAIEAAAEESEKWWELFQKYETRQYANPNQIAARIRTLKDTP